MSKALHHGDLFDVLPTLEAESIDACVTDPPYGIGFMGKKWDTFKPEVAQQKQGLRQINKSEKYSRKAKRQANPNLKGRTVDGAISSSQIEYDYSLTGLREFQAWTESWAREVLRVMKPGAYIVVCGAPRAHHRMMAGLEDAGFEIRDCFAWLFGSGFPKSYNQLGDGKGTALKPAHEPIALARKPFKGTIKDCHERYGTAALNIDACRIAGETVPINRLEQWSGFGEARRPDYEQEINDKGRWPANVLLDEEAAALLDEQTGEVGGGFGVRGRGSEIYAGGKGYANTLAEVGQVVGFGDSGGASRFYYVAKPSREERDFGTHHLPVKSPMELTGRKEGSAGLKHGRAGTDRAASNYHPTVKPVALMRWLVKLVTPIGGVVLDPFTGSGTTGMACAYEQRQFIGIEREAEYIEIARARIAAVAPLFSEIA